VRLGLNYWYAYNTDSSIHVFHLLQNGSGRPIYIAYLMALQS
jgi:hypothetical protein